VVVDFENAASVVDVIQQHLLSLQNKEAVMFVRNPNRESETTSLSYYQVDSEARRIANWLQEQFPGGERILLLYPVGLEFVTAFFGCLYAGMVAVPAPLPGQYHHNKQRVKAIAKNADISAVFTDSTNLPVVLAWAEAENLEQFQYIATDQEDFGNPNAWTKPPLSRETLLLLQYTSGSTGEPKGVMITHGNLLHNVASFRQALGFTEQTRFGGWIPLFHDMGLMAQLLPALFLGSTCVLMTPNTFVMRPHLWLTMIDKYNIQYSAAPNFAFDLCCQRVTDGQIAELDLSRWEFATNGSEPVQASTLIAFAKRFAAAGFREEALCPCYGMAEATVFISGCGHRPPIINHIDSDFLAQHKFKLAEQGQPERNIVSCGIPRGCEVRIVDLETCEVLPAGRVGEIWLRGDSISRGYWHNERATRATFQASTTDGEEGYLRTGDLGIRDGEELYVTGRIKEILIVHGRNLYPQDIEHEIRRQHSELSNRFGAVFTVSVEEEEAVIVTHEIRGNFEEEQLREITSSIKTGILREFGLRVLGVVLIRSGSVRRTTSGKIQRTAMRELFLANALPVIYEELAPQVQNIRRTLHQDFHLEVTSYSQDVSV